MAKPAKIWQTDRQTLETWTCLHASVDLFMGIKTACHLFP